VQIILAHKKPRKSQNFVTPTKFKKNRFLEFGFKNANLANLKPSTWNEGYQRTHQQTDKTHLLPLALTQGLFTMDHSELTSPTVTLCDHGRDHESVTATGWIHRFHMTRLDNWRRGVYSVRWWRDISSVQWQQSALEHHNQSGGRSVGIKANYYLTFHAILHSPTAHIYSRRFFTNRSIFQCLLLHHTYNRDRKLTNEQWGMLSKLLFTN